MLSSSNHFADKTSQRVDRFRLGDALPEYANAFGVADPGRRVRSCHCLVYASGGAVELQRQVFEESS